MLGMPQTPLMGLCRWGSGVFEGWGSGHGDCLAPPTSSLRITPPYGSFTHDLKSCELVSFPDAIYLILKEYEIKQLSLAKNKLKKFPKRIPDKFEKLQVLSLKENQISELPEELSHFGKLKALDLAGNAFTAIPDFLLAQPHLRILNLAHNKIESVDVDVVFSRAEKLQILNLQGNPLCDEVLAKITDSPHKEKVKIE